MNKVLFGLVVLCIIGANAPAMAQCAIEVEHEVQVDRSGKTGSITIKFLESYGDVTVRLFDLRSTDYEFTSIREVKSPNRGFKVAFEDLPFSKYVIQLETDSCKKTIGGMDGITLGEGSR